MIQFLEDIQGRGAAPLGEEERLELDKLRKKKAELIKIQQKQQHSNAKGSDEDSEDDSGDEGDDIVKDLIDQQ